MTLKHPTSPLRGGEVGYSEVSNEIKTSLATTDQNEMMVGRHMRNV